MKPQDGGSRRIDRVLAEGFLDGLSEWPMAQLRERRRDAEQEEADLSYIRRMLQGRLDIVLAELRRRAGDGEEVVDILAEVLADEAGASKRSVRYITVEPSRVGEVRRAEERAASDVLILDVESRSDAELNEAIAALRAHETEVSELRRQVQQVADALSSEVARRYRDGGASIEALLGEHS